jgi:hypothetical protein
MSEPNKIDRKLPPHELNARRRRKRAVATLPNIADLPKAYNQHEHHASPNDTVYNHATDAVTNHV